MDLVMNGPNAHGGNVGLKSAGCGNRGAGEDWPAAGWWGLLGATRGHRARPARAAVMNEAHEPCLERTAAGSNSIETKILAHTNGPCFH